MYHSLLYLRLPVVPCSLRVTVLWMTATGRELYLHQNRLTGTLPLQYSELDKLEYVHFRMATSSKCQCSPVLAFTRRLAPASLYCRCPHRWYYVNNNQLSGTLPEEYSVLYNLQYECAMPSDIFRFFFYYTAYFSSSLQIDTLLGFAAVLCCQE